MGEPTSRSLGERLRRRVSHLWTQLCRFSLSKGRISRGGLEQLCAELATDEYALVVHSTDVNHKRFFPNSYVVDKREGPLVDLPTDPFFSDLSVIGSGSFNLILCTGLLEHIPDPDRLAREFHRILKPGGRLILSASSVFPSHGNPNNFFHFTPNGLRLLFRDWSGFARLTGSSRPFKTIAILLQRIHMQCDIFPPIRPLIELAYHLVPALDWFVIREYDSVGRKDELGPVDSMMAATLHAIVVR